MTRPQHQGDYTAISGNTVTFAANSTVAQTRSVTITADNTVELDETLKLVLSSLTAGGRNVVFSGLGATLTGTGTITNDDSAVLSLSGTAVAEGNSLTTNLPFTVSSTNPIDTAVTVAFSTADGTALEPGDYTAQLAVVVTLPANTTSVVHNVSVNGDTTVELDETLTGSIGTLAAAGRSVTIGSTSSATGTITNDDQAVVSINTPSVDEDSGLLTFTISLSKSVDTAVTMAANTADGTATLADSDYTAIVAASVTFPANSIANQTKNITVTVDNAVEPDETVKLVLSSLTAGGRNVVFSGPGATLTGTGTITNDDSADAVDRRRRAGRRQQRHHDLTSW